MGGIKHHLQQYGSQITNNFNDVKNPIDRHMAYMAQQVTPFCRGCGKQIVESGQDEQGNKVNYQVEQARLMCTKCYNLEQEELRRIAQAEREKLQVPKETDWEAIKKKYSRE